MINELGEDRVKTILSEFSCPQNKDVENFLKYKSIEFAKQRIASTHLLFSEYKGKHVLIGYFSISTKVLRIKKDRLSRHLRDRIKKFGTYNSTNKHYEIAAHLIAQLSKNFINGYDKLITGDELLKIACDCVNDLQIISSGKFVYLECENKERLLTFYEDNGFVNFGKRELDRDEDIPGTYLIQMLKYL